MMHAMSMFHHRFEMGPIRALLSGGAMLTWLATGDQTNGQFSLFEAKGIPGMEPPPHIHSREDESYYLLDGEMWFKVGDEEFTGKPGDFVFLPRNIRHEFKVISKSFHCLVGIYPSGLEQYLDRLSIPHLSDEMPPLNPNPPSAEVLDMLQKLDAEFGIITFI